MQEITKPTDLDNRLLTIEKYLFEIKEMLNKAPSEDEIFWDADDMARIFKVSARHISERMTYSTGFPRPVRLPNDDKKRQLSGSKQRLRWRKDEVLAFIAKL